jgi:hypothetical protein
MMGWLKSDAVLRSAEFENLPDETKEYLNKSTVPHYEVASHFPIHMLSPNWGNEYSYICLVAFVMNGQSKGEVRLQSSDPAVQLLFNPNFLSHEYECVRGGYTGVLERGCWVQLAYGGDGENGERWG